MYKQINSSSIIIDKKFQALCKKPFYGHPAGCPNYGKKEGCPPCEFTENNILDFNREIYVIYTSFEVGEFAEKMRLAHPEWAKFPRQLYNPRRWQPMARKMHRQDITEFLNKTNFMYVDSSPEARGVNITSLMDSIGIKLNWQWPPKHILENNAYLQNKTYIVSLAGYLIHSHK